jgi:hypothetical protein
VPGSYATARISTSNAFWRWKRPTAPMTKMRARRPSGIVIPGYRHTIRNGPGEVAEVAAHLAAADITVVPIRFGGGPGSRSWRPSPTAFRSSRRPWVVRVWRWSTVNNCWWPMIRTSPPPPASGWPRTSSCVRDRSGLRPNCATRGIAGQFSPQQLSAPCRLLRMAIAEGPVMLLPRPTPTARWWMGQPKCGLNSPRWPRDAAAAVPSAWVRAPADSPWCNQQRVTRGPTAVEGICRARAAFRIQRGRSGECGDWPAKSATVR